MSSKRRTTFATALAAVPLALMSHTVLAATTSDTCVKNGNFETCDFSGWVASSVTADAPYINKVYEDGWGECSANMGGNSVPHDGQTVKVRSLSQEIDLGSCLPRVGDFTATLSFEYKYRNLAGPSPRGPQSVTVSLNGQEVMAFNEKRFPNKPDGRPLLFIVQKETIDVTEQLKTIVSDDAMANLTLQETDVNADVLISWDNIRIDFATASSSTTAASSTAPTTTEPMTTTQLDPERIDPTTRLRTKTKVKSNAATTTASTIASTPSTSTTGTQTTSDNNGRIGDIGDRIRKHKTKTKVKRHGSTMMLRH